MIKWNLTSTIYSYTACQQNLLRLFYNLLLRLQNLKSQHVCPSITNHPSIEPFPNIQSWPPIGVFHRKSIHF